MSAANTGTRLRWVWAVIGALAAVVPMVLFLSLARAPAPVAAPVRAKPAIELTERAAKSALDDEATLLDPTPLFLPTKWNAGQKDVAPPEPGGAFQSYRFPAKSEFAETDLKLGPAGSGGSAGPPQMASRLWTSIDLPDPVAVPQKPVDTLGADAPGALALGFGRTDTPVAALPARGALVEIVRAGSGEPALPEQAMAQVQELAATARPPGGRPWRTMEFVAAIDAAGLAAPLAVTTQSGVEEVDVYFQNFLERKLRVGERLAPGFYRISIGP